jgi:hypothetical protein
MNAAYTLSGFAARGAGSTPEATVSEGLPIDLTGVA